MKHLVIFLYCFVALSLMWVGAEYVFEGAVHSSYVDAVVCAFLAKIIQEIVEGEL